MGTIELVARDGHRLAAYRADPAGSPRGGVVVIQEIFGVNQHIRRVTDGFAADGYAAIAPAMFDRLERGVELGYTPETITRGRALKVQITTEMAMLDIAAAVAVLPGKVGVVGYCWGGFVTWLASAHAPGIACAVPYYGGGMLENAELVPRVPVQGHFAIQDTIIPVAGARALAARHPAHQFHFYNADHGFNCDERDSYDADAAGLARERTLAFFREHLG